MLFGLYYETEIDGACYASRTASPAYYSLGLECRSQTRTSPWVRRYCITVRPSSLVSPRQTLFWTLRLLRFPVFRSRTAVSDRLHSNPDVRCNLFPFCLRVSHAPLVILIRPESPGNFHRHSRRRSHGMTDVQSLRERGYGVHQRGENVLTPPR